MISERETNGDATRNQWRRNAKPMAAQRKTTNL